MASNKFVIVSYFFEAGALEEGAHRRIAGAEAAAASAVELASVADYAVVLATNTSAAARVLDALRRLPARSPGDPALYAAAWGPRVRISASAAVAGEGAVEVAAA